MPERTIRFYKARTDGIDARAPAWRPRVALAKLQAAISHSDAATRDSKGRRMVFGDVLPDEPRPCLSIALSRYDDLPLKHDESYELEPLDFEETEAIAERTHAVFFPLGVVAIEHNARGPWSGAIAAGIRHKVPDLDGLYFSPLINMEGLKSALGRLTEVTRIDAKLRVSHHTADEAAEAGPPIRMFDNSVMDLRPENVSIGIWVDGRTGNLRNAASFLRGVFGMGKSDYFEKLTLKGPGAEDGKQRVEEVLATQIVQRRHVIALDERSKAVHSPSAYAAMMEAYKSLRTVIRGAAGIE